MKLYKLFEQIQQHPEQFTNAEKWEEFENKILNRLKSLNYTALDKDSLNYELEKWAYNQLLKKIKPLILDKFNENIILHPWTTDSNYNINLLKNCYIYQPFWSQNYPDIIVFWEKHIIPIEIKYSKEKSNKPMRNSNLPKWNWIYIFWSYWLKDVTFFLWKDVLPYEERKELINFFEKSIKPLEKLFKENLKKLTKEWKYKFKYGFNVYVRRAYQQDKKVNPHAIIDFFNNPNRQQLENNVINFLKNL
jgi:hypothetical protein